MNFKLRDLDKKKPVQEKLYSACAPRVWLRSCEQEVETPLKGRCEGNVPRWLSGDLLRNGPGLLAVGPDRYKHLFDSAALLHRFCISDGAVSYQCRFLRSRTYLKNRAAERIVVSEFGTGAAPDPCRTIFDRVKAVFQPGDSISDNAMISLYPFGDEMYAFTEGPVIHRIDPGTLVTCERVDLSRGPVALVNHTSHPHVMPNGDVYNVGMSVVRGALRHVVVMFPRRAGDMFAEARVVATLKPRWPLHPAYMHSFGITEHYFVIIEQPLTVSVARTVVAQLTNRPLASCLKWYPDEETHVVLLRRSDGEEERRYRLNALFFLHVINAYEAGGTVMLDLCAYRDARVIDAMYVRAIEEMHENPDYADWFRARPVRLELGPKPGRVVPRVIADLGCETPTVHRERFTGRPYRYFYAIGSDVDTARPGTILKVDVDSGETLSWSEEDCYPSEPVFVPEPNAGAEDAGVLLSALVWGADPRRTALLVLAARDLSELARVTFELPSPAPKCLHGWFLAENKCRNDIFQ